MRCVVTSTSATKYSWNPSNGTKYRHYHLRRGLLRHYDRQNSLLNRRNRCHRKTTAYSLEARQVKTTRITETYTTTIKKVGRLLMEAVYTNPRAPGSFGGVDALRRHAHKSRKAVVDYLAGQDAYTLHRSSFPRRRTYSKGIADLFQIDLAHQSNLSPYNDWYRYLLNCIDVLTKRAWEVENLDRSRGQRRLWTHSVRATM